MYRKSTCCLAKGLKGNFMAAPLRERIRKQSNTPSPAHLLLRCDICRHTVQVLENMYTTWVCKGFCFASFCWILWNVRIFVKIIVNIGNDCKEQNKKYWLTFPVTCTQCCGSGMFMPDPGSEFFHPGSRPKRSRIPYKKHRIPDPDPQHCLYSTGLNCYSVSGFPDQNMTIFLFEIIHLIIVTYLFVPLPCGVP